jgi:lysophospholipase L1-like esterase
MEMNTRMRWISCCLALALCWLVSPLLSSADAQSFYLKSGDTVVFYGDSITAQNLYNQWVEVYTVTRFPSMRVHFYGAGVGGDRVSGGSGGPIDERLARDVFAHKPTVVTVMLGMNDGGYRATTDEIQSTYTKGFDHLLESIHTNAPGARVTLLGPSPFDEVTRPAEFPGGYNAVMLHFGDLNQELARKSGATFVNLNPAVVQVLGKAQLLDPLVAKLILPDRVHPQVIAHWAMAEALLKGWNAPALVSSVTIDAHSGKVTDAQNATVEPIERDKDVLRWTETEKSLPLAFNRKNETERQLLELTDLEQQLNQEPLLVTGLDAGQYQLTIDDKQVGTFSAEELTKGINLADYDTPMRAQSQRVGWKISDHVEAHYIHMQMQIKKVDTGGQPGKPDVMDGFENFLEDSIYEEAAPKPHVFSLSPVSTQP